MCRVYQVTTRCHRKPHKCDSYSVLVEEDVGVRTTPVRRVGAQEGEEEERALTFQ